MVCSDFSIVSCGTITTIPSTDCSRKCSSASWMPAVVTSLRLAMLTE